MEKPELKEVEIYTDGACSGNPGPGGFGVVLKFNGKRKEISQGYKRTTNNRMELMAVISGLNSLKTKCKVAVYSDSKYIVDAINKGWLYNWKKKNWVRSNKEKVLNPDLWEQLYDLLKKHEITFEWVKGHANNEENERCDVLAVTASKSGNLLIDYYCLK